MKTQSARLPGIDFTARAKVKSSGSCSIVRNRNKFIGGGLAGINGKWSYYNTPFSNSARYHYGNGCWVAVTNSSKNSYVSYDNCVTWNGPYEIKSTIFNLPLINFINGRFLVHEYDASTSIAFYYSVDGMNWSLGPSNIPGDYSWAEGVYAGNRHFVITASGTQATSMYSSDGLNWTSGGTLTNGYTKCFYFNNQFWYINNASYYQYTNNGGQTWATGGALAVVPTLFKLDNIDQTYYTWINGDNPCSMFINDNFTTTETQRPIYKHTNTRYGANDWFTTNVRYHYNGNLVISQGIVLSSVYIVTPRGIIDIIRPTVSETVANCMYNTDTGDIVTPIWSTANGYQTAVSWNKSYLNVTY